MNTELEIYGTLGPSCAEEEILRRMFAEGITGMRLNLSHTALPESAPVIEAFHRAASLEGVTPSLLIDMQGPELRIGSVGNGFAAAEGEEIILTTKDALPPKVPSEEVSPSVPGTVPVPREIFSHYEKGMILMIDDGRIRLKVIGEADSPSERRLKARVLNGGLIRSRKSIAIMDRTVTGDTLTEQDLMNLRYAAGAGVTDVMQPFVRGARDLLQVRRAMAENGAGNCRLFAKIENRAGIAALQEILPLTDMLVIARGDLGNAVPLWQLPGVQKEISRKCLAADVPFMVVTQMLASMEQAPVPTRAEVSDIFNAVADGAGAVMITGESASGKYPVQAARYLVRTAREGLKWRREQKKRG